MKIGDIVEFKKTKNRYRIAGFGRMKNPGNGKWLDSVIYEQYMEYSQETDDYKKTEPSVYIREKEDFEDKFEPSIPKVQIYNSETGQPLYDFGVSEKLLSEYFDAGLAGQKHIFLESTKPENMTIEAWCQNLAGDILIGGKKEADDRITQEALDRINADLADGKFGSGITALGQIQMLIFFLTVRMNEPEQTVEGPNEVNNDEPAIQEEAGDQE